MFLVLMVFCFSLGVNCQEFIDNSRSKVMKKLEKYVKNNDLKSGISQTDSSISLFIDDPRKKPAEFIFLFSGEKCAEEIKIACDSCVMKYLDETLLEKSMGWQKMNDSTYLSKYTRHRMMSIHFNGNASSLRIRKTNWDKKAYSGIVRSL